MANFSTQIQALVGTVTESELDDWCAEGAKEIINILPPKLKEKCMTETTLNNSSPTMDLDGVGNILYVSRLSANSGGFRIPCRKVPSIYAGLTSDSSSLLYYGTVTDPVYWIQSTSDVAILNVYPSPEATQTARVYHVAYPTVDASAVSTIANFPDEAEHLVVLYAAQKALLNKISELEIPPDAFGDGTALTSDASAIGTGQIGVDADFLEFDQWFTALGEMIEDDEDIELASAQIEKINAYVNTWNIQLQGNLAEMQQYMTLFQTLKADYTMGIQMLVSGGMPQAQAQPQQARR